MKLTAVLLLTLALGLALFGGCASGGAEKGNKTATSVGDVSSDLKTTRDRIVGSLTSLNALVTTKTGDLRPAFKTFSSSVKSLGSAAKDLDAQAARMRETGEAYFADWDAKIAQISNPETKATSQARREEVRARFANISSMYTDVRTKFEPFMGDLTDIRAALETDLTAGGIAAIDPSIRAANTNGAAVRASIEALIKEFDTLSAKMSSTAG